MSAGAPSPDSRQACSPSASDSRFSSCWTRALSRTARSWAASRSACSEARVTAGPVLSPVGWVGFQRVDLLEQVAVPVEEGAVDAGGAGDPGHADLGAVGGGAVERGDDALAAAGESAGGRRASAGPARSAWWLAGAEACAGHAVASGWSWCGCGSGRGRRACRGDGVGGAVTADHGDGLVDLGAFGVVELGDVALDPGDQPPDPGDLLLGGGGVGAGPLVDAVDGGGQPFPGAQQVIEVGLQVGQVRDVGAEVVAAGAAEPDRAGAAAGLDVGRLGAGAVGDGDLADGVAGVLGFQQGVRVAPDPVAVPVEAERGDRVDGVAAAVFADPVVAAGDARCCGDQAARPARRSGPRRRRAAGRRCAGRRRARSWPCRTRRRRGCAAPAAAATQSRCRSSQDVDADRPCARRGCGGGWAAASARRPGCRGSVPGPVAAGR